MKERMDLFEREECTKVEKLLQRFDKLKKSNIKFIHC